MKDNQSTQKPGTPAAQSVNAARRKNRAKKRWATLILLVLVLAALGWGAMKMTKPASSGTEQGGTFAARRGDLIVTVTVGGSIRAHQSIQYKCQVERRGGEVTILNIVPGGTYITQEDVDQGKVLVKLDSSALEERLIQEEMELSSDKQSATAEKESYDIQVIQNESSIANGKLNVRFALMDLQKYLGADLAARLVRDVNEASDLPEHVAPVLLEIANDPNLLDGSGAGKAMKEAQDGIVTAEASLKTAEARLAGTEKLHDANYVSELDLQGDQLTVIRSRFSEENANVDLDLFLRYDLPKDIETYLSAYIETGRELERTYAQCRSELAQADARLSNANQRYQQQAERVRELQEQIEYCTIRARAPGLVIYGSGDSGDAFRAMRGRGGGGGMIAEGEVVYENQTIISMPDMAAMVAEINVHETEVDKVRPGQPAEIVMDAFPDRILQGEVIEVAPLPDQQRGFLNPDLKVYKTQVAIDGKNDFLKTRMSCKVQILVQNLEDVIQVPIQVVANRRGRKVCYVATPQGPEDREVQTGAFNDTFVQITEGLEAGEIVLLNPPPFTESGTSPTGTPDRDRFGGRSTPKDDKATPQGPTSSETSRGRRGGPSGERPQRGAPSGQGSQQGAPSAQQPQMRRGSFELTDEMINRILVVLKTADPAGTEALEKLRKSDPEAFKTKLREKMKTMGPGPGGAGGFGGRQGRRSRSSEAGSGETAPRQPRPEGQNDR
jgi:HlyD family secretion protein